MKLHAKSALFLCFSAAWVSPAYSQRLITTIAGSELLFKGESAPATAAPLGRITAVSVDAQGRPVFADPYYHLVLRVNTDGSVEVLAGNNVRGYSGDGGSARSAALSLPQGTAYDPSGTLFVADVGNNVIRKITPQGVITTYAGNGKAGTSGDGGRATAASLTAPVSVAVDGLGNLFINEVRNDSQSAQGFSSWIRKVTPVGTISTFASRLPQAEGIAADLTGNVYVTEFYGHRVRRISPDGQITVVAGTGREGPPTDGVDAPLAQLSQPGGVAVDPNGTLIIVDTGNGVVRRVARDGKISTIAGSGGSGLAGDNGPALRGQFRNPFGVAVSRTGDIFIADRDNYRIRRINSQGTLTTAAGNGQLQASPEGAPAASAALIEPAGVTLDATGNIYVADYANHLIRRVDTGGRIITVAGNGAGEFTGDQGRAILAGLDNPSAMAVDRSGNLYIADTGNDVVRRVGTNGTISTVVQGLRGPSGLAFDRAGNLYIADSGNHRIRRLANGVVTIFAGTGAAQSSGDGGPAINAGIFQPVGIAIDGSDNIFVVEHDIGGRVRKITPQGTITTVAGGGSGALTEGAPATSVRLRRPKGVAVDRDGALYITDMVDQRVYRVAPNGMIGVLAGDGSADFAGDGGLAVSASLNEPFGIAVNADGSVVYVADSLNNRIRAILSSRPTFAPASESISLTATSDGASEVTSIDLTSSFPGLVCQATTDGQKWLRLTSTLLTLPVNLEVRVDPTGVGVGTQRAEIRVSCPAAQVANRIIPVNLQVQAGTGPKLAVDAKSLTVSTSAGTPALLRQFSVRNAGSGSAVFAVTSAIESGAGWLSASAPQSVTAAAPANVEVTVDPSRLAAGTYSGSVTVSGATAAETFVIPVLATVNPAPAKIVLPLTALTFTAAVGGGAPLTQSIAVLNGGQGTMSWRADAETLSGADWLRLLTNSGTADASATDASSLQVGIDTSKLTAGKTYYARLKVSAAGAPNSPQTVSIALNVLSASENPGAEVNPSAVTFSSSQGVNPGSQEIRIANLSSRPISYTSSVSAPWLSIVPASATLNPGEPARLVIQPLTGDLTPESYKASITLQFDDKTTRKVDVLALISAPEISTSGKGPRNAGNCTTQSINAQFISGQTPLRTRAGQALNLEARVLDNCGVDISTMRGSTVKMGRISTGEPGFDLMHVGAGKWTKSWSPRASANTTVRSYMTVAVPLPNARFFVDSIPVDVTVTSANAVPLVEPGNVLNAASFKQNSPIAPGMLISVFGAELAEDPGQVASTVPLPTELSNTEVRLGDKPLRLLFSSSQQINAQIPFDLNSNTEHQIVVKRGETLSTPENFAVSTTQPAVFAINQRGTGQAAITNAISGVVANPSSPVRAGDFISIYCTGLGAVTPLVEAGVAAPTNSLSSTVNLVTVTVGGRPANVTFSGLAPGFVGLYQVNAIVPSGVAGDEVPVVLDIDGQTSPTVTIAVR